MSSSAAERVAIKILCGGAMRGLMDDTVPLFERGSGTKVTIEFGLTSALKKAIADGAPFDIAVLPRPELDELAQQGKIASGTQTDITRSAIGVAVRAGAAKPNIATVDAFRRMLQRAASITYSDGPSGAYVGALLQRLGIAAEMKPKTRLTTGPVAELVAKGEAEIGIQQIVAILPVQGAELAGLLPGELQNIIVYAAGLAPQARNSAAARTFIAFMAMPEVIGLIRARGMEPG
jgi:molybdate transport system substrate-binding protein